MPCSALEMISVSRLGCYTVRKSWRVARKKQRESETMACGDKPKERYRYIYIYSGVMSTVPKDSYRKERSHSFFKSTLQNRQEVLGFNYRNSK